MLSTGINKNYSKQAPCLKLNKEINLIKRFPWREDLFKWLVYKFSGYLAGEWQR